MKFLLKTSLIFVLIYASCNEPPKERTWPSARKEAEYWYEQQEESYNGSRQSQYFIDKSLKADPTYARAWMRKAEAHIEKGEFAKGFKYLNEAVELEPIEHLGYRGCAKLYYLHDMEGALKDLIELDSLTPNFTDAPWGRDIYYTMGVAEKGRGDLLKALMYFTRSIYNTTREKGEDWVDVKVFLYRGITLLEMDNPEMAIADFDKCIFYFDKFMEAHYYKGIAFLKLGQCEKACEYFKKAKKHHDAGYSYANQMYSMVEEVLVEDILENINLYCE